MNLEEKLKNLKSNYETVLKKANDFALSPFTLIAVSKKQPIELLKALVDLDHKDFGENYVQELISKAESLKDKNIKWHFIGHLQRNKVKVLLPYVASIHTVDSERLMAEISKRAEEIQKKIPIYIQVNIDLEESKSGCKPEEVSKLIDFAQSLNGVQLQGLMCIPRFDQDPTESFKKMKKLRDRYLPGGELSMGMSSDFEIALKNGATQVRVGSSIFGERES